MTMLVASIAGALGAVCRYLVSGWVQERSSSGWPVGTFVVNVVGALGLGVVVGAGQSETALMLVGAGFLGGFTTFSTWMIETLRLGPVSLRALANLLISLAAGVLAAALGYSLVA